LDSRESEIILTIFLSRLKDQNGKKLFTQAMIGQLIGYSRQTTNYTLKSFKEGGFDKALSKKEYDSSVFTYEVKMTLKKIWYSNPFLKTDEVITILKNVHPELKDHNISAASLYYNINQDLDFLELRKQLKGNFKINKDGHLEVKRAVVIKDLLNLLDCNDKEERKRGLEIVKGIFNLESFSDKIKEAKEKLEKALERKKNKLNIYFAIIFFLFPNQLFYEDSW